MGLIIEISVNIEKINVSSAKKYLSEIANNHNCISEYDIFETEGYNNKIERNECIYIVNFETPLTEYDYENIITFVSKILKIKFVKLDTIYIEEDCKINIIYNSIKSNFINVNGREKILKTNPSLSKIKEYLFNYCRY